MSVLFIVISETLYPYSCCNRKLVCSMLSSSVFQKTSPRSLGWNTGRSSFSEPGCHRNLHTLVKKKHVIGIEGVKFKKDHLCGACEAGKMTRAKHPSKTIMTTSKPFELLHMDLFGPTPHSLQQPVSMASSLLMIIQDTHGCT